MCGSVLIWILALVVGFVQSVHSASSPSRRFPLLIFRVYQNGVLWGFPKTSLCPISIRTAFQVPTVGFLGKAEGVSWFEIVPTSRYVIGRKSQWPHG
jgi:hypothetical protein